jgi:hypothetical protein
MKCEIYSFDLVPGSAPPQNSGQTPQSSNSSISSGIIPPPVARKTSDPIKFKRERSISEIQLFEDEQEADYRDYCMYLRIAGGMLLRCKDDVIDSSLLDSIVRTRNAFKTMTSDLYLLDHDEDHNYVSDKPASSSTPPLISNVMFTLPMRRPANESNQVLKDSPSTMYYSETYGIPDEDSSVEDEIFALDF